MSLLSQFVGQIESGNNPNASLVDYAGNTSVNAQYQQSAAYVATYGSGASGIDTQASQLLAQNPNATLGDFYSLYNHGSVLNWGSYSSRFPLQAGNFSSNAAAAGYNQNTPLSTLVGNGSTATSAGDPFQDIGAAGATDEGPITSDPLGSSVTMGSGVAPSSNSSLDWSDIGDNTFDQDLASDPAGAGVGSIDAGSLAQSLGGGGGAPVNITDLPGLDTSVSGAGKAVQSGATTVGSNIESSAGGIAGTAASIFNAGKGYFSSAVVVIGLIILGLIFVAFGLSMFKHNIAAAV